MPTFCSAARLHCGYRVPQRFSGATGRCDQCIRVCFARLDRKLVGTVMQDDQLFAGSIADNIAFFDPAPDHERVQHAAKLAAVHDEVIAMPMQYNTLIGDMGAALSGGQRQRLLLARALYKQPSILFLDEATSALDIKKEKAVNEAVRSLRLTRIIIAHRPETIASADRVIVLQNGRVVQDLRRAAPGANPGAGQAPAAEAPVAVAA